MNILEFLWRILDNIIWIIGASNPMDIVTAVLNIIGLFLGNLNIFG
jgi:hypothetical protein